jgi:hypothetical protein
MSNYAYTVNDFQDGDKIVFTEHNHGVYYHGEVTKVDDVRVYFDVYKKFSIENDKLLREFDKGVIRGSVNEVTIHRLTFLGDKSNRLEVELDKRQRTILQSLFFDLAQDTKDDQWLESLKSEAWKKELLQA